MKGLKAKEDEKYRNSLRRKQAKDIKDQNNIMKFTYLDLVPLEFNKENVMNWLANSGWIEGLIIKSLGDLFPYLDDYIQEIYLLIFEKLDKLIDIYETKGILAFCGYVKIIIITNCYAQGAQTYKKLRYFGNDFTIQCSDEMWNNIIDTYDADKDAFYKFDKTNKLI